MIYTKTKEPNWNYHIRQITHGNKTGEAYAITVPRIIAQQFVGVNLKLYLSDNMIIFSSGCRLI